MAINSTIDQSITICCSATRVNLHRTDAAHRPSVESFWSTCIQPTDTHIGPVGDGNHLCGSIQICPLPAIGSHCAWRNSVSQMYGSRVSRVHLGVCAFHLVVFYIFVLCCFVRRQDSVGFGKPNSVPFARQQRCICLFTIGSTPSGKRANQYGSH